LLFLDDIIVKGLYIVYDREESFLGICKYILEYIMWLNGVFIDLKLGRCIILGVKFYFCKNKIIIISYCYNGKGWYLKELKVVKIIY